MHMPPASALRSAVASASLVLALCACQGDDNALPLPVEAGVDAGAPDAHVGSDSGSHADAGAASTADAGTKHD